MARQKPPDDGKYIVQAGEWAGSIALKFGYTNWKQDVWMRGENADLRNKRTDARQLAEGDELFVPPWEEKEESCATEARYKFKLKAPTETVRIRLLTPEGKPFKNMEYTLTVMCDPGGGVFKQANQKTDGDGIVCEKVPSTTTQAKLLIKDLKQTIKLKFGFLNPMDKNDAVLMCKAVQQRLLALGFYAGPVNGKMNNNVTSAIKSFQKYCADNKGKMDWVIDAGKVDGKLSDDTQAALKKFYGS